MTEIELRRSQSSRRNGNSRGFAVAEEAGEKQQLVQAWHKPG